MNVRTLSGFAEESIGRASKAKRKKRRRIRSMFLMPTPENLARIALQRRREKMKQRKRSGAFISAPAKLNYLDKLKTRLSQFPKGSFGAHLVKNEIDRLTGAASTQTGTNLSGYKDFLTAKSKNWTGTGLIPGLIKKEIALIESGNFAGTTALGISGIGKKKKKGKFLKKLKKFGNIQKKLALAPMRASALALIALNFMALASKISRAISTPQGKARFEKKWKRLGGDPKKLFNTVKKGAKKKPLLGKKQKPIKGIGDIPDMSVPVQGIGLPQLAAVIAAAVPIITALMGMIKKGKGAEAGGVIEDMATAAQDGASVTDILKVGNEAAAEAGTPSELPSGGEFAVTDAEAGAGTDAGMPTGDPEIDDTQRTTGGIDPKFLMIGAAGLGILLLSSKK